MDGSGVLGAGATNLREIKVKQINLNKAHPAQVELLNKLNKLTSYIALVTEPFCYKQKLSLPPKHATVIPNRREGHPRAAIFCSKNIIISELDHLGGSRSHTNG